MIDGVRLASCQNISTHFVIDLSSEYAIIERKAIIV